MACVPQFSLRNTDFCDSSFRGGLKRIYIAHREGNGSTLFGFNDISGITINDNASSADYGYVTLGTISAGGPVFAEIKFNKKDGVSVFTDVGTSTPDGIDNITPSLIFEIEGMNQQTSAFAYKILKSKDIVALIETAADTWHLVGVEAGLQVEELNGTTGASYDEKNRIRVTLVGQENEFSKYIQSKADFDALIELTEASALSILSQLSIYDSEIVNGSLFPFGYQTGSTGDGCYQVALTGGTGSGAEANVCFVGGQTYLDMITITNGGSGYLDGDVLEGNFSQTSSELIVGNYTETHNPVNYNGVISPLYFRNTNLGINWPRRNLSHYGWWGPPLSPTGGTGTNASIRTFRNLGTTYFGPILGWEIISNEVTSGYSYGDVISIHGYNGIKQLNLISSTIVSSGYLDYWGFATTVTGSPSSIAQIQVIVDNGTLIYSDVAFEFRGWGYSVGDTVSITNTSGDYFLFEVTQVAPDSSDPLDTLTFEIVCEPSYTNVTLIGGSGSGATVNLTMNQATGQASSMSISNAGSGYEIGDVLTYDVNNDGTITGEVEIDSMPSGDTVFFNFDISQVYNWQINSGESFLFNVVVTNNGQSTLTNVMLEYDPPAEMSNVKYILNGQSAYYLDWLGAVNIGTLTAGQDATIVFLCNVSGAFDGNSLNTIIASTLNGQVSEDITIEVLP